ncbi:MAG: recombinase family protein [Cyanobacteria bacterium P01_G01_bin.54]
MSAENAHTPTEIWQRLEQGRQVKARNGGYAGYGSPAFGQRAVDGELVNDPTECQIIELIRRHHKSGKSLQKIADWLNRQGYTTKRGQAWRRISVKRVLDRLYGKPTRTRGVNPQAPRSLEIVPSRSDDSAIDTKNA